MSEEEQKKAEILGAISSVGGLGLTVEVCGEWVWVSGDTKPHKETLKSAGFKWSPKKVNWYFKPSSCKSFWRGSTPMDTIKANHGCIRVRAK